MNYITPVDISLEEGQYQLSAPATYQVGDKTYSFSAWADGVTGLQRIINLDADTDLNVNYVEVIVTVNVTFKGAQSKQIAAGETVIVTVTKPDATTEVLTAITIADLSYTVSKAYTIAGSYKAKAHGDADAQYSAWDSAEQLFTIALETRTGTLVVTVA